MNVATSRLLIFKMHLLLPTLFVLVWCFYVTKVKAAERLTGLRTEFKRVEFKRELSCGCYLTQRTLRYAEDAEKTL